MIEGAVVLLVGLAVGFVAGRLTRRHRPYKPPPDPKPMCGCEHHYSMHHPETGRCNVKERECRWDTLRGVPIYTDWAVCPCQRYVGPEPMPRMIA